MIKKSFRKLRDYIEKEDFKGWDPYDGLNSSFFNSIPILKTKKIVRLIFIQLMRRSSVNLRGILRVEKEYNPKGLGLFLSGYCKIFKEDNSNDILSKINFLANKILNLISKGWSGFCWGYNFDWQARAFFQPKFTPTVVATTYVASSLLDAYDVTKNTIFLDAAISSKNFILNDLNRTYDSDGDFCFSYSPLDKTQVFNASLLGTRLLSRIYSYTGEKDLIEAAKKSIEYCIKYQKEDGSWPYGTLPYHQWIDSFHTGFNIECIDEYQRITNDNSFQKNIDIGLDFYIKNFFSDMGVPKYYPMQEYPIDIHSASQLIVTLIKTGKIYLYKNIAERVLEWTIKNMQDKEGFFYYQKKKFFTYRIPYMRWSQAWAFYALSLYLSS